MIIVNDKYVELLRNKRTKKPRISKLYSMDYIFKLVYKIPKYVPVSYVCLLEHGANFQFNYFYERLLKTEDELIFFDNSHRVKSYYNQTGKISYAIGPLYPKYRKLMNIKPKTDRKGTLAFPSHSSSQFDFSKGYLNYINELKNLPDKFHPISICLYYYDIINGHFDLFRDAGFQVLSNGYIGDPQFVNNLYDHISSFQYITSNHLGSYSFYAIEMGIPFFLYGEDIDAELINNGKMNGVNMNDFIKDDFLQKVTKQTIFNINEKIEITPELKDSIDIIMDEKEILSIINVRSLVLNNWLGLLSKKILKFFKSNNFKLK